MTGKPGRPKVGLVIEGESTEERNRRLQRERTRRFRTTETYARAMAKHWQKRVDAFEEARVEQGLPRLKPLKRRTKAQMEHNAARQHDYYWRKKQQREELEAAMAGKRVEMSDADIAALYEEGLNLEPEGNFVLQPIPAGAQAILDANKARFEVEPDLTPRVTPMPDEMYGKADE